MGAGLIHEDSESWQQSGQEIWSVIHSQTGLLPVQGIHNNRTAACESKHTTIGHVRPCYNAPRMQFSQVHNQWKHIWFWLSSELVWESMSWIQKWIVGIFLACPINLLHSLWVYSVWGSSITKVISSHIAADIPNIFTSRLSGNHTPYIMHQRS